MLVRAVKKGYYGVVLREPGQIFRLKDEKDFADHLDHKKNGEHGWMEKVDQKAKPAKGSDRSEPVGARPADEDQAAYDKRVRAADKMFEEAVKEDSDGVI